MFGNRSAQAEIAWALDKRLTEVVHPDAIDDDASSERIIRRRDRSRQVEPAAAVRERLPLLARDDAQELSWYTLAELRGVATDEHPRVGQLLGVEKDHCTRRDIR